MFFFYIIINDALMFKLIFLFTINNLIVFCGCCFRKKPNSSSNNFINLVSKTLNTEENSKINEEKMNLIRQKENEMDILINNCNKELDEVQVADNVPNIDNLVAKIKNSSIKQCNLLLDELINIGSTKINYYRGCVKRLYDRCEYIVNLMKKLTVKLNDEYAAYNKDPLTITIYNTADKMAYGYCKRNSEDEYPLANLVENGKDLDILSEDFYGKLDSINIKLKNLLNKYY